MTKRKLINSIDIRKCQELSSALNLLECLKLYCFFNDTFRLFRINDEGDRKKKKKRYVIYRFENDVYQSESKHLSKSEVYNYFKKLGKEDDIIIEIQKMVIEDL